MLKVVFSDSEKGSMKVAKNYNEKNMMGGAGSYIGKKPTKVELEKHFEGQEVEAGKFYQFLLLEKQSSQIEKRIVSDYWHDLMVENTSLRAIINGKLISVPESFYDFIITKNLPDNDFIMARLIGKLLGEYRLGIRAVSS